MDVSATLVFAAHPETADPGLNVRWELRWGRKRPLLVVPNATDSSTAIEALSAALDTLRAIRRPVPGLPALIAVAGENTAPARTPRGAQAWPGRGEPHRPPHCQLGQEKAARAASTRARAPAHWAPLACRSYRQPMGRAVHHCALYCLHSARCSGLSAVQVLRCPSERSYD